jgi:hypothetical protein
MGGIGGLSLDGIAWPGALWEMAAWCYSYLSWSTGQHLRQNRRGASPTAARAVGFRVRSGALFFCEPAGVLVGRWMRHYCSWYLISPRPASVVEGEISLVPLCVRIKATSAPAERGVLAWSTAARLSAHAHASTAAVLGAWRTATRSPCEREAWREREC